MVKFGRHQQFYVDHNIRHSGTALSELDSSYADHATTSTAPTSEPHQPFIVPYNDAKTQYIESPSVHPETAASLAKFEDQWRQWLRDASDEFQTSYQHVWQCVFGASTDSDDWRGAPPEKALVLFCDQSSSTAKQQLLDLLKGLHETSLLNAEALRKLVKKYDKHLLQHCSSSEEKKEPTIFWQQNGFSTQLLPLLYCSNFVVGLLPVQQGIDVLRSDLGLGDYAALAPVDSIDDFASVGLHNSATGLAGMMEATATAGTLPPRPPPPTPTRTDFQADEAEYSTPLNDTTLKGSRRQLQEEGPEPVFKMLSRSHRKDSHAEHLDSVDRRRQESQWLHRAVQRMEQQQPPPLTLSSPNTTTTTSSSCSILPHLVAHRGFHSPKDRSDRRPLENSLQAYESAWTSGIHLCECDIALTKDEHLILAHDEDFSRLALDVTHHRSNCNVRDLTLRDIMSLALTSGVRPPLLTDVLQSAHAIGGTSQLIIEIKPGNREAASALARLFAQQPHLMAHCAVVMSFDSFAMHALQEEMDALGLAGDADNGDTDQNNKNDGGGNSNFHRRNRSYSLGISPSILVASASSQSLMMSPSSSYGALNPGNPNSYNNPYTYGAPQSQPKPFPRPKLMLLTVSDAPKRDVELQVSVQDGDILEKVGQWTKRLSGVYMQYEQHMLTPEGSEVLQSLRQQNHLVGVWGYADKDPDDYETSRQLIQMGGVNFVNTDLPRNFFQFSALSDADD